MRFFMAVLGSVATVAVLGCDSTSPSSTGAVRASVTTSGGDLDQDGYQVVIDGNSAKSAGVNESVELSGLEAGFHNVGLMDVAANCVVHGANPQRVAVNAGETTDVSFNVECAATGVRVTLDTTGFDFGSTTYQLTVDGSQPVSIELGESATVSYLAPGTHTVSLSPAPPDNCAFTPGPSQDVALTFGAVAPLAFTLTCTATTGMLEITTSSTGLDLDPDGYLVAVDGGTSTALPTIGVVRIPALAPGDHELTFAGAASNCTIGGTNPRTVTITAGVTKRDTTRTSLDVACLSTSGVLEVTYHTTGVDLDVDGYHLAVDGVDLGFSQPVNGTTWRTGVSVGAHQVGVTQVAANCTVAGENPRSVTIAAGSVTRDTARTTFDVDCTAIPASVVVTTTTTGASLDDAYHLDVDLTCDYYYGCTSAWSGTIGANDTLSLHLADGAHSFLLSGIVFNCSVSGANPIVASTSIGVTAHADFHLNCLETASVRVTAPTTGSDLATGYSVLIDGVYQGVVGAAAGDTVTLNALPGGHSVALSSIPANCTANGPNPVLVTLTSGVATDVAIPVLCYPNPTLRVTVTTTGTHLDDAYIVGLDADYYYGYATTFQVGANGVYSFNLPVGGHYVYLDDIAANCALTSPNGVYVNMPLGTTTDVAFTVVCN